MVESKRKKRPYKPYSADVYNRIIDFLRRQEQEEPSSVEEELEEQLRLVGQLGKFYEDLKRLEGLEGLTIEQLMAIATTLTRRLERLKEEDARHGERQSRRDKIASFFRGYLRQFAISGTNFLAYYAADWCLKKGYQINKENTRQFFLQALDIDGARMTLEEVGQRINSKLEEILRERSSQPVWKESAPRVERAEYAVRDLERTKIDAIHEKIIRQLREEYIKTASGEVNRTGLFGYFKSHIKPSLPALMQEEINWEREFEALDTDFDQSTKEEKIQKLQETFHVYHFNIGNPGEFNIVPSIEMKDAFKEAVEEHGGYGNSFGELPVRQEVAAYYKQRLDLPADAVDEDGVLIGAGASELISFAMRALGEKEEMATIRPIYSLYTSLAGELGAIIRTIPVREQDEEFIFNPQDLEEVITPETRYLIVNSPNNPTGMVYTEQIIRKIIEIAKKYSLIIISDEIYADDLLATELREQVRSGQTSFGKISYDEKVPCVVIGGLSKGAGEAAGWRVGWAALLDPDGKAKELWKNMKTLALARLCSNVPAQYAALPALRERGQTREHLKEINERIRRQRNVISEELNIGPLSCPEPEGSYYAFFRISGISSAKEENAFAKYLLIQERVHIVPGAGFGYRETPEEHGWFRLVFLAEEEELIRGCMHLRRGAREWLSLSPEEKEKYYQNIFAETA